MEEGKESRNSNFSFMQETVKQKKIYQNRMLRKAAGSVASGALFGLAALAVWSILAPRLQLQNAQQEVQPITIPEEEGAKEPEQEDGQTQTAEPVYITETVSMELEDYKNMYQQLEQIGNQVQKSLVNILAVMTDTDWFEETYTSQSSASGLLIGDNGLELLILTEYEKVKNGESFLVTFYDYSSSPGTLKKYDKNTGLAVISVNLSDLAEATRNIIVYADFGSSRTLRSGEPVIAVGSPAGHYGSVLFGNLTSVLQYAPLYDGYYNVLTTDMTCADLGSGALANWSGQIVGILQERHGVNGQKDTIQAYGISDIKNVIEHLSNNQDIAYMGIVGADVTTAVSEAENIPVGVHVSKVAVDSPAIQAGIQPGDIITFMNGQPVTNLKDVMSILLICSNEQTIQVTCLRPDMTGYQKLELSVRLSIL